MYTHKVTSETLNLSLCRRKQFKFNLINILKRNFSLAITHKINQLFREWILLNYPYSKVVNQSDCLKQQNQSVLLLLIHNSNNNNNNHLPLIQMFIIDRTFGTSIPENNWKIESPMNGMQTKPKTDFETFLPNRFNNKAKVLLYTVRCSEKIIVKLNDSNSL